MRFAAWALAVAVVVLAAPAATFLANRRAQAPQESAVHDAEPFRFGVEAIAKELFVLPYGDGARGVALRPDTEAGAPMTLEVVVPDAKGRIWVVDHPVGDRPRARVRVMDAKGRALSVFHTAPGSTMFTPGLQNDLWVVEALGEQEREEVVRYDMQGKELRRYPLPTRFLARSLSLRPNGEVYAHAEEWLTDPKTSATVYSGALLPVAVGASLEATTAPGLDGAFWGADGNRYVASSVIEGAEMTVRFKVVAIDAGGREVAKYALPSGARPFGADSEGRVYAESPPPQVTDAVGQETLGDAAGTSSDIWMVERRGTKSRVRVFAPSYATSWAPSVFPVDGGFVSLAESARGVRVIEQRWSTEAPDASAPEVVDPAEVQIVFPREPVSGNPYDARDMVERDLMQLVYAGLVSRDASGVAFPELVEAIPTRANGGVSKDGLTVTYRLRDGVRWHDARPVVGADVVATWEHLRETPLAPRPLPFPGFSLIREVTADGQTVRVRLSEPFGPGPVSFFPWVLPGHLLKSASMSANARLWSNPVGCGPYRLARWNDNVSWQLIGHDASPGQPPRIDRIDVLFAANERALSAFQGGQVPTLWVWPDAEGAAAVRRDRVGELEWRDTGRWIGALFDTRAPFLGEVAVRKAILAAYPRLELARSIVTSEAVARSVDPFPPRGGAHASSIERVSDSPAEAGRILGRDGWRVDPKLGRYAKGGVDLAVAFEAARRERRDEVSFEYVDTVTSAWKRASIGSGRRLQTPFYYLSWVQGGRLTSQRREFSYGAFPSELEPGALGIFDPANTPGPDNPFGIAVTHSDDEVLRELNAAARLEYDPAARYRIGRRIAERIDALGLAMFERYEQRPVATLGSLKGYAPGPYPAGDLWNVELWELPGETQ